MSRFWLWSSLFVDEPLWKHNPEQIVKGLRAVCCRHQDWWCWLYRFLVEPAKVWVQWSSHTWLSLIDEPHHRTTDCTRNTEWLSLLSVLSVLSVLSGVCCLYCLYCLMVFPKGRHPSQKRMNFEKSLWPSLPLIFGNQYCRFLGTRWRLHVFAPL